MLIRCWLRVCNVLGEMRRLDSLLLRWVIWLSIAWTIVALSLLYCMWSVVIVWQACMVRLAGSNSMEVGLVLISRFYRVSRLTVKVRQARTVGLLALLRLGLWIRDNRSWTWVVNLLVVPPANARLSIRLGCIVFEFMS